MQVRCHHCDDVEMLNRKAHKEKNAKQRDRYRAVALALEGNLTQEIMRMLDRSKNFVQRWTYAYRDGGIDALIPKPQIGRPSKLSRHKEAAFKQRILAGPTENDNGICTLRAKDAMRILEREFGVSYSLWGIYDLLHRLGLSCLKPRPRHNKNNPDLMQQWLNDAPFLSTKSENVIPTRKLKSGLKTRRESVSKAH